MSLSSVEEERLETLKRWWDRFGTVLTALVVVAAVGVAGYYGWDFWNERQLQSASAVYSQALMARQAGDPEGFEAAYERLRTEYGRTTYAVDAALLNARDRYQQGALDEAIGALRWAVDHAGEPSREATARARLARLYLERGDPDAALAALDEVNGAGFRATVAELRGDAWLDKGDRARAREAYEQALEHLDRGGAAYEVVEMKLLDVGGGES